MLILFEGLCGFVLCDILCRVGLVVIRCWEELGLM